MLTTTAATEALGMIVVKVEVGEDIRGVGEEATMVEGEDLGEGGEGGAVLEAILGEVLIRVEVEGQVSGAVSGTMLWVSLEEDTVIVEVVVAVVEGLEETWEVLEVVAVIEALEVGLEEGGEVVGEEGKDLDASQWIPTHSEELRDPSTLTNLRRTRARLKPLRCEDLKRKIELCSLKFLGVNLKLQIVGIR